MAHLGADVAVGEEVVGDGGRACDLGGAREAEDEQVEHQPVELHHEGGELQAADDAVRVGVVHVLEGDVDVVLGRHVVGDVVVEDQAQQAVEERQVDLRR